MKKVIVLLICCLTVCNAQFKEFGPIKEYSVLVNSSTAADMVWGDAISVGSLNSFANPALLASFKGYRIRYSNDNYLEKISQYNTDNGSRFNAYQVIYGSNFGTIAFTYSKLHYKAHLRSQVHYIMECIIDLKDAEESLFKLDLAKEIIKDFHIGVSMKLFQRELDLDKHFTKVEFSSNPTLLFDLGAIYKTKIFEKDEIMFGLGLRNFGVHYKEQVIDNIPPWSSYAYPYEQNSFNYRIPRFLQFNAAYKNNFYQKGNRKFYFSVLMAYKNLLNPGKEVINLIGCDGLIEPDCFYTRVIRSEDDERNYWSLGTELSLNEVVKIQLGAISFPFDNEVTDKGDFSIRAGLETNISLDNIIKGLPIYLQAKAGFIPSELDEKLFAFDFGLTYLIK